MNRNEPRNKRRKGEVKGKATQAKPGASKVKSESDEAPRESREAFVFTDRSGKQHLLPPRGNSAGNSHAPLKRDHDSGRKPEQGGRKFPRGPGKPADRQPNGGTNAGAKPSFSFKARGEDSPAFRSPADRPRDRTNDRGRDGRGNRDSNRSSRGPHSDRGSSRGDRENSRGDRGSSRGGRGEPRSDRGGSRGERGASRRDRNDRGDRGSNRSRRPSAPHVPSESDFKLKARIDKNRKGFAFLQFESREYEDAFLSPFEAERFFHGDRVEAVVTEEGEVVEVRVIEHRFRELVGRYYRTGKNGMVVYERKKAREELLVVGDSKSAKTRDWVRAKVIYPEEENGRITCEILEAYGEELPASADIQMVSAEYNLVEEHSPEAVAEAESFKLDLADPHRVDLRHVPFITIDGETARDFDDAVYVERNRENGYTLWVAIADVSHYVRPGTTLDDEALSRGTSVYFPERAFHMLPRALSENLCSLRPDGPRLTMTAKIDYDRTGKKLRVEVMNSLIQSRRRATYNEIQKEADENVGVAGWEFRVHYDLYAILRKKKNERGSIDFDLPEAEVKVEPTGEPISIKNRPRLDAHRLIEEFMIAANESVTEWALEREWPFVYRVHDEPSAGAMAKFADLCKHHGVPFVVDKDNLGEALNEVVKSLEGNPAQILLNMALLRSMAQAHYSSAHGIHFGLASQAYTHFTSPIRRYPDLVVHRMLKLALDYEREKKILEDDEREEIEKKLAEITEHCSYRERIASDAERESIKLKQTRIMLKEIGNEFPAKVNGMLEAGMFATLEDPFVEGFIATEAMAGDSFSFNVERQVFVGRRSKKTFKIGDSIRVRVDNVDLDLRRIDLGLVADDSDRVPTVAETMKELLKADDES
ncbi:MAG: ribonuclease R [Cryobacterium sp.]|nr:ribonuclease R [Oligoflexia bacterium]